MRLMRLTTMVLLCGLFLAPLSLNATSQNDEQFTLATWNLNRYTMEEAFEEVPGSPANDRTEFYANVIRQQSIDVLALQEVSSCSSKASCRHIDLLADQLGFDFIVSDTGSTGGRYLVIMYRTSMFEKTGMQELKDVNITGNLRGALVLRLESKAGGFDGTFITLHNDAGTESSDESNRREQIKKLDEWIENDMQSNPDEHDYAILGDFNEPTDLPSTERDEDEGRLDPLEDDFEFFPDRDACTTTADRCRRLDHIALTDTESGMVQELVSGPTVLNPAQLGFNETEDEFTNQLTNHLPLIATLEDEDND